MLLARFDWMAWKWGNTIPFVLDVTRRIPHSFSPNGLEWNELEKPPYAQHIIARGWNARETVTIWRKSMLIQRFMATVQRHFTTARNPMIYWWTNSFDSFIKKVPYYFTIIVISNGKKRAKKTTNQMPIKIQIANQCSNMAFEHIS